MWSIEVMLRKSENSWERLKTSMEHLKTSDIILRKCLHRGWLCIAQGVVMHKSYNQAENIRKQQRTSENSWLHRKTSKIIWYHPENNWGPIIDSLVQFEEDSNSRTKKWVGWIGLDRLFQTTPISRSLDGDNNWGPIIDSLVQFEEDFNSRTKKWVVVIGLDRLSQTRPIPR